MRYTVTIGDRTFEVDVEGGRARLAGKTDTALLQSVPGTPERHLIRSDGVRTLALNRRESGWELVLSGDVLEARVVDEHTRSLEAMARRPQHSGGVHLVRAPMPGMVVRVEVELGEHVRQGQGLVVLEAMKMENELGAPAAGKVTAVRASARQAVEKGAVLVEVTSEG